LTNNGKIITCNIGRGQVKRIDALVTDRVAINRSNFLRDAVTRALYRILVEMVEYLAKMGGSNVTGESYIVTVNLTPVQVEAIDALVNAGTSPSRSDFLRDSAVVFLQQTERFVAEVKRMKAAPARPQRVPGDVIDMRTVRWQKEVG
jgi:Arc/MetJ-type ribon-helix-helix transcriptional regulator